MITKNFASHEFACRCGSDTCDAPAIKKELVRHIQELRDEIGKPIYITNGVRCKPYNEDLARRGYRVAPDSPHLYGLAADITTHDFQKDRDTLRELIDKFGRFTGVGVYSKHLHVDIKDRGTKEQVVWVS